MTKLSTASMHWPLSYDIDVYVQIGDKDEKVESRYGPQQGARIKYRRTESPIFTRLLEGEHQSKPISLPVSSEPFLCLSCTSLNLDQACVKSLAFKRNQERLIGFSLVGVSKMETCKRARLRIDDRN